MEIYNMKIANLPMTEKHKETIKAEYIDMLSQLSAGIKETKAIFMAKEKGDYVDAIAKLPVTGCDVKVLIG